LLERFYLFRNREYFLPGVMLSVIVLGSTLTLEPGLRTLTRALISILMFFWTIGVALLAVQLEYRWHDVLLHRGHRRDTRFHAALITVFAIPFFIAEIVGMGLIVWLGSYSYGVLLLSVALLNARFHYLLKAPASAGRCLVNRIEGLEACLAGTADQAVSRLGRELTPAVYEQLLPYAIALGREEQWSRQFADVLNRAKDDGQSYQPAWIRTEAAAGGWNPAAFAGAVGGSLAAAIAASAAGASATSGTS